MFYRERFKHLRIIAVLLLTVLAISVIVSGQSNSKPLGANKMIYVLEPIIVGENTRFRVDLYFKGNSDGVTKLRLPSEWDGQERLYNQIKNLRSGSSDTRIDETSEPHVKSVAYLPNAAVHIQYDVVQDWDGSAVKNGLYNRAVLQKNYFYFIGNSFWLYPDWELTRRLAIEIQWKNFPRNWSLADSFGAGETRQTVNASLQELIKGVYLGGDFRIEAVPVRGKPVYTATRGDWKFSDREFQTLVRRLTEQQRAFWNDDDFPFYLVVLFPVDGANIGGEARTNSFSLYIRRDAETVSSFQFTLAHELFHLWNPIKFGGLKDESLYWFSEGLTDYYAALLLLRGGFLSLDDYVAGVNGLLKTYYTSPMRNLTGEQILTARRTDYNAQRQPYQRGNLLAHNWNARIKSLTGNKRSLDNVMRDLFRASRKKGFVLSNESIDAAFRGYLKEGIRNDVKQYVEQGDLIAPTDDILGACFVKGKTEIAPFDAGFDIEASFPNRIFQGVRENSNAYEAGLRNGQKWVKGGVTRDPTVLAEFIVEESGAQKNVKYYPAGRNKTAAPRFELKTEGNRQVSRNCQSWLEN